MARASPGAHRGEVSSTANPARRSISKRVHTVEISYILQELSTHREGIERAKSKSPEVKICPSVEFSSRPAQINRSEDMKEGGNMINITKQTVCSGVRPSEVHPRTIPDVIYKVINIHRRLRKAPLTEQVNLDGH